MDFSEDYHVHLYKPGDEKGIVDLLSLVFNEWRVRGQKALDHWRWMYIDNPYGLCIISVIFKDDTIVGVAHDLNIRLKIGEDVLNTKYGTDLVIHPDHRGKRLSYPMRNLRRQNREDTHLVYSYTTNKMLIERSKRKRRTDDDPSYLVPVLINRYLLIKDIDLHLENKGTGYSWLLKQGYQVSKWVSQIQSRALKPNKHSQRVEIHDGLNLEDADSFWERIKGKYDFISKKDREYLEWRYLDPRAGDYNVFSAYIEGEFCGYIVAGIDYETLSYPMGNIIDLMSIGDIIVEKVLLDKALAWLLEKGVNAVNAFAGKDSQVGSVLESAGFVDRGDSLVISYRVPNTVSTRYPLIDELKSARTHLMYSDFYVK